MVNAHTSLGIAQVVFYVPVVPLAIWLMVRNWAYRPRMAWWPIISLSLMRLAGGAITIALEKNQSDIGLIIAALVLLNVGAIPLVVANMGQIRIIILDSLSDSPHYKRLALAMRLSFIGATALLVAGGAVGSEQTPSSANTAKWLSLGGYIIFALVLACLITLELWFLATKKASLIPTSRKVLTGTLLAAPFIIIRCVYGILEVCYGFTSSLWSPIYGNVVVFALMALLCEYIVICIWLYLGFSMPPDRDVRKGAASATGSEERKFVV